VKISFTDRVTSHSCMPPIGLPGHLGRIIWSTLLIFWFFTVFKPLVWFVFCVSFTREQDICATIARLKFVGEGCAIKSKSAILWTSVRIHFGWNMIRKWSSDLSRTRESMFTKLYTDFRHNLVKMFIHFERFDSGLQRYGSVVKIFMMKFAPKDILWMILMQNCGYIGQIFFQISSLNSWDTECCSFDSVIVFTWLYWFQIVPFTSGAASFDAWFVRKRKEYTKRCCHSCMLPNEMVNIILWLVMSQSFWKITTSHVDSVERLHDHKAETW
jgi:hypothetical protein